MERRPQMCRSGGRTLRLRMFPRSARISVGCEHAKEHERLKLSPNVGRLSVKEPDVERVALASKLQSAINQFAGLIHDKLVSLAGRVAIEAHGHAANRPAGDGSKHMLVILSQRVSI